jgi:two-component system, cell cycle sensor histidine kinase and response regulator CckA
LKKEEWLRVRNSLSETILFVLIGVTVMSILVIGYIWIADEYARFHAESKSMQEQYVESRKSTIKNEVLEVIDYLKYERSKTEGRLKQELKERTLEALQIARNLYREYKNIRTLAEIKKMVKDVLRVIRFHEGAGYYFATRLDGFEVLFADRPELEGKKLLDLKDTNGKFVIRDMIRIAKEQKEGFYRYNWTKPNSDGRDFPKLAFIKYFEPFDWFIGTGCYLDDMEKSIQREVLERLGQIRYGERGYVFAFRNDGTLLSHFFEDAVGRKAHELIAKNGPQIIDEMIDTAQKEGGGFVEYLARFKPGSDKPAAKMSFVKSISAWQWVVGVGFYTDELEEELRQRKMILTGTINANIRKIVIVLALLCVVVILISRYISRRAKTSFDFFTTFFEKAAKESSVLDLKKLYFAEFKLLAASANQMVKERERFESDLKKSNRSLAHSQAIGHMGSWEWNAGTNEMYWSEEGCRLLGKDPQSGNVELDFYLRRIHPDDRDRVQQALEDAFNKAKSFDIEYRFIRLDGNVRIHHTQAEVIREPGSKSHQVIGVAWDITELKATREELARLAQVVEQAGEIIMITDNKGIIQYVNPSFERITGYTRKEVSGESPRMLKSGRVDAEVYRELWETISEGKTWHGRLINKKKDGSYFQEDATIFAMRDNTGHISNFVAVKHDVTQHVQLEQLLHQAQKMEAIGTLAGGIAHDFNNILGAIIGYSEIALDDIETDTEAAENLRQVLKAGKRAKELVRQILSFSRLGGEQKVVLKISRTVKEAIRLLRATLPSSIEIVEQYNEKNDYIMGEATRIHQVMLNLCSNAAHAMEENENGGTLTIRIERITLDESNIIFYPELKPGNYIRLIVKDNGKGMDPATMERIFDPYFTTKEKGKGTGLGMAVVHGIVRSHSGSINVTSRPGEGSTFEIMLPAIDSGTEPKELAAEPVAPPGKKERVLLVDDETMLTDMAGQMLRKLDYIVTTVNSPTLALDIFKKNPDGYDLLITDMTMPHMQGDKLAQEIKKIRTDIPIVLCTGYSEQSTITKANAAGINHIILKPLSASQLGTIVHKALNEEKGNMK